MGLKANGHATIWSVENKGKYSVCSMSTNKKDKQSGEWSTDWSNKFCRFVGEAHNKISGITLGEGEFVKIKLGSDFEVTNNYDKAKKIMYTNYTIFDFDFTETQEQAPADNSFSNIPIDDVDLPFA